MEPTWESSCGTVKLWHGDCVDVLGSLGAGIADATITDAPYSFEHVDGGGFAAARSYYAGGSLDGLDSFDLPKYADMLTNASDQLVAFHSRDQIREYAEFCGERFGHYDLHLWHKSNAIPFVNQTWKSDVEYIALGWRRKRHQRVPVALKSKVYQSGICRDGWHPTVKPVALMAKYVAVLVAPGGTVLDPFMGSGTTGVAAIALGRRFLGVERDPGHFAVAKRRLQGAIQERDGRFDWARPDVRHEQLRLGVADDLPEPPEKSGVGACIPNSAG